MSDLDLPSQILVVLGMHRSGSSALTRALSLAGFALPKTLIKDNLSNRRGHWESQPIARLNDGFLKEAGLVWSDWGTGGLARVPESARRDFEQDLARLVADEYPAERPAVLKEPRICRLMPHYRVAFEDTLPLYAVIAVRNPLEVMASLVRRNNMTEAKACLLWLRYMLDAVEGSAGLPRAFIAYDRLLSEPVAALRDTEQALGTPFPTSLDSVSDDIVAFLSNGLRNHENSTEDVVHKDLTRNWISDAYGALRVLTRDPSAQDALSTLSRIKHEFDTAEPLLGQILDDYDSELDELRREAASLQAAVELRTEQVGILRQALADAGLGQTASGPAAPADALRARRSQRNPLKLGVDRLLGRNTRA